jgi:hypothetical protein
MRTKGEKEGGPTYANWGTRKREGPARGWTRTRTRTRARARTRVRTRTADRATGDTATRATDNGGGDR